MNQQTDSSMNIFGKNRNGSEFKKPTEIANQIINKFNKMTRILETYPTPHILILPLSVCFPIKHYSEAGTLSLCGTEPHCALHIITVLMLLNGNQDLDFEPNQLRRQ